MTGSWSPNSFAFRFLSSLTTYKEKPSKVGMMTGHVNFCHQIITIIILMIKSSLSPSSSIHRHLMIEFIIGLLWENWQESRMIMINYAAYHNYLITSLVSFDSFLVSLDMCMQNANAVLLLGQSSFQTKCGEKRDATNLVWSACESISWSAWKLLQYFLWQALPDIALSILILLPGHTYMWTIFSRKYFILPGHERQICSILCINTQNTHNSSILPQIVNCLISCSNNFFPVGHF